MTTGKGKTGVLLSLVLIGAVMLSGVGLLGLLLQAVDRDDGEIVSGNIKNSLVNEEIETAQVVAEERFEGSFEEVEAVKDQIPNERSIPISHAFDQPDVPPLSTGEQEVTRSDDDLLSENGFIGRDRSPGAPDIDMDDTLSQLNGHGSLLEETYGLVRNAEVPKELPTVSIDEEATIPVTEDGVVIEDDMVGEVSEDLIGVSGNIKDLIGDIAPDTTSAGIGEDAISGTAWDVMNSTIRDSDKDGNPEWKYEVRVAFGVINKTLLNGTLEYVIGFEYEYRDDDSDGIPNYERSVRIKLANFTVNGAMIAEGLSFTEAIRNDTDGDNTIDHVEIRHISYGYHATVLRTVRSFATAGKLIMDDKDNDGIFEEKEGTVVFFFRHQTVNPDVILREYLVLIHGKEDTVQKELSKLAFTRINNTMGVTLFEKGYIWSYREDDNSKNLLIIAGKNNTVTGKVQYVIFNGTETTTATTTSYKVTAFAVENSTLLLGGQRSDMVAIDHQVDVTGNQKDEKGFLAAARNDRRPNRIEESFLLISVDRTEISGVLLNENSTVLAGKNVTTDGLDSIMGFANRIYIDNDADGNPEYVKVSWAVGRSEDLDNDGIVDREGYIVSWNEIKDNDDDGNPEWNQTFVMMGWKLDDNDDGNIDLERGLVTNITVYDNNSNGTVELKETGIVGFEKADNDSDGTMDSERYMGAWEKVEDVHDDGTEINKQSGTWAHEE